MTRMSSKNIAIGLLLFINVALGMALIARELRSIKTDKPKAKAASNLRGSVQEATLKNDSKIQACYDAFLARGPSPSEGAVVMHWIFNAQGEIDFLKLIRSDLQDQPFLDCLLETVRNTRMPAADVRSGRLISHKFTFRRTIPSEIEFQ